MKKLLYSLSIVASLAFGCFAAAPPTFFPADRLWSTNILMFGSGAVSNQFTPGSIVLSSSPVGATPLIRMVGPGSLGRIKLNDALPNTLDLSTDVRISGDLDVAGTVTGSAIVYSLTNITTATNAWFATNAPDGELIASTNYVRTNLVQGTLINYATNAQTTTVDMSIPYGDVDVAGGITFAGLSNTKDTAYQTAVVFVKNTTGVVAPIAFPATWTNTAGPLRVTNYTICTIFRNPGRFTNIVTLPVW